MVLRLHTHFLPTFQVTYKKVVNKTTFSSMHLYSHFFQTVSLENINFEQNLPLFGDFLIFLVKVALSI